MTLVKRLSIVMISSSSNLKPADKSGSLQAGDTHHEGHDTRTSVPPLDDLPAALQPGGLVDSLLQLNKGKATGMYADLHMRIEESLRDLRLRYRDPPSCTTAKAPPEDRYKAALANSTTHFNRESDPVLRYSLAQHECMDRLSPRLFQEAFRKYVENPDGYELIVGELIPENLRAQGRYHLAEQGYLNGTHRTAAEDWNVHLKQLAVKQKRPFVGLATGLTWLDTALLGMRRLTFVAGGPGVGKTSMALIMAVGALRQNANLAVLYCSLEPTMTKGILYDRLLCHESGLDFGTLHCQARSGEEEVVKSISEASRRLLEAVLPRIRIIDFKTLGLTGCLTTTILWKNIIDLRKTTNANQVLTVIDYFQIMGLEDTPASALDADHKRMDVLRTIQSLSSSAVQPGGHPFLVISEVRKNSARTGLDMTDLLGSTRLSYAADTVLLLEQADDTNPSADIVPVTLKVAKGRDGTRRTRVDLLFDHGRCRFAEAGTTSVGNTLTDQKSESDHSEPQKFDPLACFHDE